MKLSLDIADRSYSADLSNGIDISIGIFPGSVKAWYVGDVTVDPVRGDGFVGSVAEGGPVNFMDVSFNPHGNGTHTECVAHISDEEINIIEVLDRAFFAAQLLSIEPNEMEQDSDCAKAGDRVVTKDQLENNISSGVEALIIRTLPNPESKTTLNHSGTNPTFFEPAAIQYLIDQGIDHLLIDVPSVDREEDGGHVLGHHVFWNYPKTVNRTRTITELIYVPDAVHDGLYLLNLQIAPFKMDASPSRPILFPLV